jgi:hypothetical protein
MRNSGDVDTVVLLVCLAFSGSEIEIDPFNGKKK